MENYKYVAQFSFDIADDGDVHSEELAEILEQHGFTVVGSSWICTWDAEEYEKGLPPMASN